MLFYSGFGGGVHARFVVDSAGRVPIASFEVLRATHELFSYVVKGAVSSWRFQPAIKAGRPVAVRYEQEFEFSIPIDSAPLEQPAMIRRDTSPAGIPRIVIGTGVRDRGGASRFTDRDLLEAQRAALVAVAPTPPIVDKTVRRITTCLTLSRGQTLALPDDETLRAVARPHRRAVTSRECPRTYASMIYDPKRRAPRGWIDPYIMVVTRAEGWNADAIVVDIEVGQGTATTSHRCGVRRRAFGWQPECRVYGRMIS